MMRYVKTVVIQSELEFKNLHIGQWFQLGYSGAKGQYLGQTRAGCYVCRYGKFSKENAERNKLQREYVKQFARINSKFWLWS